MGLSLEQLITDISKATWKTKLLGAAQGVGFITKAPGLGSGSVSSSGVCILAESVRVKISTGGECGSGAYRLSTDGGTTYGSPVTIPSNGIVVLSGTGVTLAFANGPTGSGESFTVGDIYALELTLPTLPVTGWQPGSTPLTLMEIFAEGLAEVGRTVRSIAMGGFARYTAGPWADLFASFYDLTRNAGVVSHRTLRLTDVAGVGPQTITTGQLWVGTVGGLRWVNTAGGTLSKYGTLDLDFAAESTGGRYNVGAGNITVFFTSLPGVSISDPGGVSTIITAGQDTESDSSLVSRCLARWPSLSVAAPNENYDLWAKTATTNVTRTQVRPSPTVAGQVEIYLAGPAGAVSGGDVTTVTSYITPRLGTCITALIASAAQVTQAVTATVYCAIGTRDAVTAAVEQNLDALINGGLDSAGETLDPVPLGGTLYLNQVIEQLQTPAGVRNAVVTVPSGDTVLTAGQVLAPGTYTVTVTEVA